MDPFIVLLNGFEYILLMRHGWHVYNAQRMHISLYKFGHSLLANLLTQFILVSVAFRIL